MDRKTSKFIENINKTLGKLTQQSNDEVIKDIENIIMQYYNTQVKLG